MKKILLLLILINCQLSIVNSQTLTLDSCLALARRNNVDIRTSRMDIDHARQVKRQVFTKFFPQVNIMGLGYYAANPLVHFSIDDVQSNDMREILQSLYDLVSSETDLKNEISLMKKGANASLMLAQPIFAGGRIITGNKLASLGVEAAELQAEMKERDVLENVESTFFLVTGLQQKVATVSAALALIDSLDHVVQAALASGLVTRADALQLQLKRNEMLANQQQLTSGIRLSKRLLCTQIGIIYSDTLIFSEPHCSHLRLADDTAAISVSQMSQSDCSHLRLADDTAAICVSQMSQSDERNSEPETSNVKPETSNQPSTLNPQPNSQLSTLNSQLSTSSRPEHRLLELSVEAEQLRRRLTLGEALPQLSLIGSGFYGNVIKTDPTANAVALLSLSIPLAGWWETSHKLRQHDIRINEARIRQQHLNQMMSLEAEKAYSDMLDAASLLRSDSTALEIARENYRLSTLNYQAGLATLSEVLQAQALLLQAQNALTDRQTSFLIARRRLLDLTTQN